MQFFATVKNTSTVSTSDIKAALNAEYADTVEGKADVKNSNRNEKVSSEALYKIIVMGGIPGGNSKLLSNYEKKPKPEDINDFLKEGEKSSKWEGSCTPHVSLTIPKPHQSSVQVPIVQSPPVLLNILTFLSSRHSGKTNLCRDLGIHDNGSF